MDQTIEGTKYTCEELAAATKLHPSTIRKMFIDEDGVIRIGHPGLGRQYFTLRIRASVAARVFGNLCILMTPVDELACGAGEMEKKNKMNNTMTRRTTEQLWHYTKCIHFNSISADGLIKPATIGVPKGERPITWFSTNQMWEHTVGDMQELHELFGLMRIGVEQETAPYTWAELKELSGMSSETAQHLYRSAINMGSRSGEWRGTFDAVPKEKWIAVEVWNGQEWTIDVDDFLHAMRASHVSHQRKARAVRPREH